MIKTKLGEKIKLYEEGKIEGEKEIWHTFKRKNIWQ